MGLLSGLGGGKSLVIRFIADTARATRNIDNLILKVRKVEGMGKDPGYRGAGFKGLFGQLQYSLLGKFTQGLGTMGIEGEAALASIATGFMVATAAAVAFGFAIKKTLDFGQLVESSMIQLEALTGSAKKAQGMMEKAIKFSLVTPFTPTEVFGATAMAEQYNIDLYKKGAYGLKKDQMAAQIVAGLGSYRDIHGEALGMQRAIYAIARGDRRLIRPYGAPVQEAYEIAKQSGLVGTKPFVDKFITELGKIPAIMRMAKLHSESVAGLWSTITGFFEEFWIRFSGAGEEKGVLTFWSQLKEVMIDIRDIGLELMDFIKPFLVEWGANWGAFLKLFWAGLKVMFSPLVIHFKILIQFLRILLSLSTFLYRVAEKLLLTFGRLASKVLEVFGITNAFKNFHDTLVEFVTGLQITLHFFEVSFAGTLDFITAKVEKFLGLFMVTQKAAEKPFKLSPEYESYLMKAEKKSEKGIMPVTTTTAPGEIIELPKIKAGKGQKALKGANITIDQSQQNITVVVSNPEQAGQVLNMNTGQMPSKVIYEVKK